MTLRAFLTLILIGFAAALGLAWFGSGVRAADLAAIEAATFILYEGNRETCSAQVVHSGNGETLLLTANHCVGSGKEANYAVRTTVENDEGDVTSYTVYTAKVLKKDGKNDLAVLKLVDAGVSLPMTDLATVEEAAAALFKGAKVLAAGYPATGNAGMADLVFTDGLFTGLRKSFEPSVKVDVYRATAPIWYGNSGGGLYVEIAPGNWKLVGVATQTDPETPWETSLWIPASEIHTMLKGTWLDGKDLSDPAYTER